MEYEFIYDSLTGSTAARFSMEHEIMGPWLEVEVGKDVKKIARLLDVIDDVSTRQQHDISITGNEYSLIFSEDSVQVILNSEYEVLLDASNKELEQNLPTDYDSSTECGIEDFKTLLIKWSAFIK